MTESQCICLTFVQKLKTGTCRLRTELFNPHISQENGVHQELLMDWACKISPINQELLMD